MAEKSADSPVRIIGSRELHQNLPDILRELENDTVRYVLTVHGRPRAVLIGAEPYLSMIANGRQAERSARQPAAHRSSGWQARRSHSRRSRKGSRETIGLTADRSPTSGIARSASKTDAQQVVPAFSAACCPEVSFVRAPRSDELHDARKHRDHDDGDDHQLEVLLDDCRSAEPPACQQKTQDPDRPARDVVHGEPPVAHLADARDERRERSNDRDEPRQHDRDRRRSPRKTRWACTRCFLFSSHDFSREKTFGPTK